MIGIFCQGIDFLSVYIKGCCNGRISCNFKIRKTAGTWDGGDYGWATVAIGTLPSGVSAADNGGNIQLTGLKDGTTYNLTLNILAPTIVINLSEN